MSTAGILIIGNEILSGKVEDANAPYLLPELRKLGVDVQRVHVIPDEVEQIAQEVRAFSERFDYVLTSGGVGPTHDDVTMDGVALAFGAPLARHERMEALIRSTLNGRDFNESHAKMCQIPEGARLIEDGSVWFPLVTYRNVFIFPGIPRLLQAKFESARERFRGRPIYLRQVFVRCLETEIAKDLYVLLEEFPELMLGSYPKIHETDYRTLLTLESRDESYVNRACAVLVGRIAREHVFRVE